MRKYIRAIPVLCALLASSLLCAPTRGAALADVSSAAHLTKLVGLPGGDASGVASVADRYVFAGTSAGFTLNTVDQQSSALAHSGQVPGLTPYGIVPLKMEMAALAVSPDNRTLYILNQLRQDIAVLDVTGATAPRSFHIQDDAGRRLSISPDGRYLGIVGRDGVTILDAQGGKLLTTVSWASAVAWDARDQLYLLSISGQRAMVGVYDMRFRTLGRFPIPAGGFMTAERGSLAISPDQSTLYVLWNGLRSLALPSGRITATLPLPTTPAFSELAVAPNGKQAMIWAPFVGGRHESPPDDSGTVTVTTSWVGGGVQPIALPSLRPAVSDTSLRQIDAPEGVSYSGDSARAYITFRQSLAIVRTGTSGPDRLPVPHVLPQQMLTGPVLNCKTWDIGGTWSFTVLPGAPLGSGTGPAVLIQNGTALEGTITLASTVHYTLSGSISGNVVRLTLHQPGLIDSSFTGTVQQDGKSIAGDVGIFQGTASCGSGHGSGPDQPSLTITSAGLFHQVDGQPHWTSVIGVSDPAYFAAYYRLGNAGGLTPSAQISITSAGRVIFMHDMAPERSTDGAAYFVDGITFHTPGYYTAQITLHAGSASATRSVEFSVAGGQSTQPTPEPTRAACQSRDLSGTWTFTAAPTSEIGNGSGQATLSQSGDTLAGTLTLAGTTYTLSGTVSGSTVTLTLSAPGLISSTFNGTVGADGTSISGDLGTFTGQAACLS